MAQSGPPNEAPIAPLLTDAQTAFLNNSHPRSSNAGECKDVCTGGWDVNKTEVQDSMEVVG